MFNRSFLSIYFFIFLVFRPATHRNYKSNCNLIYWNKLRCIKTSNDIAEYQFILQCHSQPTVNFTSGMRYCSGPVVRKPVNANPGLRVNHGSYFSCQKEFSKLILTGRLIHLLNSLNPLRALGHIRP